MKSILITGAAGHVGRALLSRSYAAKFKIIACDVNPIEELQTGANFRIMDVRNREQVHQIFEDCKPHAVIHLASVVTPPKGASREFAYDIDVGGTQNIVEACLANAAKRLIVTSSGAAYGYHPENADPLTEEQPIRGNYEFPYSYHKRLVEELLEKVRSSNPELEQVILRVGTVLGENLENQITSLFHKPRILGLTNNESPFVFIWDTDLADIILLAIENPKVGIFNVSGDGHLGVTEIGEILGKPVLRFPAWLLKAALAIASPLKLSQYGPEQVRFLQFRPVLENSKLKREFGYTPKKTSEEAFRTWQKLAGL